MPRRKSVKFIRPIPPDPRFGSEIVQKLINVIMERGKKNIARSIVYGALDVVIKKAASGDKDKGLSIFLKALDQVTPTIEVRPRRVGGSVYQIPVEVPQRRARALAMRWIINSAASRSDKTMSLRLAHEILEAYDSRGSSFKKKQDVHKMAEANRAFSHYAW